MTDWLRLFLIATQFLTRLPVPGKLQASEETLGKATKFFPLVGMMVGVGAALIFCLLRQLLPQAGAVLGAIIFTAFITNGFHEDGLADTFDGF